MMLKITDAIQCKTCCHCKTLGHACCTCGQADPRASDEVKEQVFKIKRHELFQTTHEDRDCF